MKLITLLLQKSGPVVLLSMLMGVASGASSVGLISLINAALGRTDLNHPWLGIAFALLCLILLVTTAGSQILIAWISQKLVFVLRLTLSQQILASPLRQLELLGSHRLLATLTEDIETISNTSTSISGLGVNFALLTCCLIYLFWLSPAIFALLIGFIILGYVSYQKLARYGVQELRKARSAKDHLFSHLQTITSGIKELKLHHRRRQVFLDEDLQGAASSFQYHRIRGMVFFAIAGSWGLVVFFIPIGLLIFGISRLLTVSPTTLSSYTLTILFMINPLRGIVAALPDLGRANVALDNIEMLGLSLKEHSDNNNHSNKSLFFSKWNQLELKGVTHSYRGERDHETFVLGPIDLQFTPGEIVFLVGGNGSGKSTLVKLITGLYIPESGLIELDSCPIDSENRENYRQYFSVVFSDYYLFNRLLGLEAEHQENQIQMYLEQLQLDHKVSIQNGSLSTTSLSQGQRKRLALLTAYLENRPIYVFDEWASDQDPIFKNLFYTQLLRQLKSRQKTVLVVSHDDRYFSVADRLIKLEYGKVVYDRKNHDTPVL